MFEHQKNHIERITTHLKRGWRDYIIAEADQKQAGLGLDVCWALRNDTRSPWHL